jgi:hypothetical protein
VPQEAVLKLSWTPHTSVPDSNVSEGSELQSAKQDSPKTSTDARRMILTKTVSLNAYPSIRDNLDHDSNVTDESDLHKEKHL